MHNLWKSLLWILILLTIGAAAASPALAEPNQGQQLIPLGTTILSAAEYDYPPFSIRTEAGQADGFSVELLRAALHAMGYAVSFQVGPWPEVKQALIERKVQVLPLVGRTPERENLFDFTFPYLHMHGTIMVRSGEQAIRNLEDLKGRQVAVLQGDNAEEFLRRSDLGTQIITTDSFETALSNLSSGQYDAVVIQKLLAIQLLQKTGIQNLRSVGPPLGKFVQSFCFAVPKGEAKLLSLLNEGLSIVIADGTFSHLQAKWFSGLETTGRSRLIVGGDSNYPPYEYLDNNGNPAGFNVDLTRAIARKLQLDVDIQLDAWGTVRKGLVDGRIDLIEGMFYSADRDQVVDFSTAHSIVGHTIVGRAGSRMPQDMTELGNKSLIVMEGDIMHDLALKHHYGQQLVTVTSQEEALQLLAAGQHDYALMARIPALYWIEKDGLDNLLVGDESIVSPEYCYAALNGNEALVAKISEAIATLKQSGEYREIYSKWFSAYETPVINHRHIAKYFLLAVLPILLGLIGVGIWNKLLKRQVAQRTAELQKEMAERRILEEQLRQAEKMQAIGQLAGGIAHDFNNQLASILGFADLLRRKVTDEKQRQQLQKIRASAQRAANLTQQLLAFSRRGQHLETTVDMKKVIQDVETILAHSIDKKIRLQTFFNTESTFIQGDPNLLQNALLNIALNARDAIQGAGKIDFVVDNIEMSQADCAKNAYDLTPGHYLKVCVIDDGCGMNEETQSRIFEPFFTTKESDKGTGMGLASVYGTITGHRGMIHVSSKLGKGTTFCVYLPLSDGPLEDIQTSEPPLVSGQANVLIVDDEEDVRTVGAEMLHELGYNVSVFKDGLDAVEYYRQSWRQVDLVILDMMMPGLNGKETFLAMQKINPQLRAILVSGFSHNGEIQDLLDCGAISFVGKPFELAELSRAVAEAIKG